MLRARPSFVAALLGPLFALPLAFAACEGAPRPASLLASRSAALGPCGLVVSRLNVDQAGIDDGSREFVELFAPDGVGQTLGACGLVWVGSYEGSSKPAEPPPDEMTPAMRSMKAGAEWIGSESYCGRAIWSRWVSVS